MRCDVIPLLRCAVPLRSQDTITGMRRKIEEGSDDPADGTGGALLRKLLSAEQSGGDDADNRMAFSDAEMVTQIKG